MDGSGAWCQLSPNELWLINILNFFFVKIIKKDISCIKNLIPGYKNIVKIQFEGFFSFGSFKFAEERDSIKRVK